MTVSASIDGTDVASATEASPEALASALSSEKSLLQELADTLRHQREAIADDDMDAVENSVHGVHRLLVTLKEARRGRRALIEMLTGDASTPLEDLDGALGPGMTAPLDRARGELVGAAEVVSEELELNRRVLRTALAANDELVRTLVDSGTPEDEPLYDRDAGEGGRAPGGGTFVDQQA